MCLEDSRSLLLLFYVFSAGLLFTKFNFTKFKFVLLAIILCGLLHYSVYKRNFFYVTFDQIGNYFAIEYGEKELNYENSKLLVPKSSDALRQLYLIISIEYVKNKNIESIIGCGLYVYWECNHELFLLPKYEKHFLDNMNLKKMRMKQLKKIYFSCVANLFIRFIILTIIKPKVLFFNKSIKLI